MKNQLIIVTEGTVIWFIKLCKEKNTATSINANAFLYIKPLNISSVQVEKELYTCVHTSTCPSKITSVPEITM